MSATAKDPGASFRVENFSAPQEGKSVRVAAGGKPVAVFLVGGKLMAIGAICPHVGGPLDQGVIAGSNVVCPWHGSQFDLATGSVQHGPARGGVPSYSARIEGTTLVLELR
jgi:nitrite reductase/ring-hydroxylating ferredoxin subunit